MRRTSLASKKGFVLLEVLLATSCLLCFCAAAFVSAQSLSRYYYKTQVRLAASTLAADIRQLQQETMFATAKEKTLQVSSDKLAYSIKANGVNATVYKRVVFAELGYGDVYFSQNLSGVSFLANGSPKVNGIYYLRHRQLKNFSCKLLLQPVTGRVTVTEYDS